jgi:hypothetical protein
LAPAVKSNDTILSWEREQARWSAVHPSCETSQSNYSSEAREGSHYHEQRYQRQPLREERQLRDDQSNRRGGADPIRSEENRIRISSQDTELDLISLRLERGFRFQERSNSLYVARSTGRSQIHRRAHSISGKETNLRLTAARCEERPERGPRRQRPRERDRDQERERERQRERDRERGTAERGEEMERERPRESEKRGQRVRKSISSFMRTLALWGGFAERAHEDGQETAWSLEERAVGDRWGLQMLQEISESSIGERASGAAADGEERSLTESILVRCRSRHHCDLCSAPTMARSETWQGLQKSEWREERGEGAMLAWVVESLPVMETDFDIILSWAERERQRQRETERERDKERETETERDRER